MNRLSTGLRVNSAADDPAGLIANEALRSEVTGISKAISNTNRASQIISTADSALSEVNNLLNEVRGLVVEAANSGGLSPDEIAANQLQIDSSLEAINRISKTTTFQGQKLLDGSLDFRSNLSSATGVESFSIDQANLGSVGKVDVSVNVSAAAEQASLKIGQAAFGDLGATQSDLELKTFFHSVSAESGIQLTGDFDSVQFIDDGNLNTSPVATVANGKLTVTYDSFDNASYLGATIAAINNQTDISAELVGSFWDETQQLPETPVTEAVPASLNVQRSDGGRLDVLYVDSGSASSSVAFDGTTDTLTVSVGSNSSQNTLAHLSGLINDLTPAGGFELSAEIVGEDNSPAPSGVSGVGVTADQLTDGIVETEPVLTEAVVFELAGANGSETFRFSAGATKDQVVAAINLVTDSTKIIAADDDGDGITLTSEDYGSEASVEVEVISDDGGGQFEAALSATTDSGSNVVASINGATANGLGNSITLNTASLDLSLTLSAGSSQNVNFEITGGGAQFQLGSAVTGAEQPRLGIGSVSTSQLGGVSGRLYELGSGQAKSLSNDTEGAAKLVDEVIQNVTSLRGRLGAFQSTTLESNLATLNDTKANLQEAASSIQDADFATEAASLTRAQILVQSGTNVLSLANQSPRSVLSLLR